MSDQILDLYTWFKNQGGSSTDTSEKDQYGNDPGLMAQDEADEQAKGAQGQGMRSKNPKDWAAEDAAENQRLRKDQPKFSNGKGGFGLPDAKQQQPTPAVEPTIADDGQTLGQQTTWTQMTFRTQFGVKADSEWVKQHNDELKKNRQLYGVSDPKAGTNPLSGAPSGTPTAPDRTIGAVAPPPYTAPNQKGGQSTSSATASNPGTRSYTTANGQATVFTPTQPYTGTLPSLSPQNPNSIPTTLPSGTPSPGTPAPIQNDDGSVTTERSITVTDPRLNGGKPTNIPTVWNGAIVNDDQAVQNAVSSGRTWQSYQTIDAAVQAAQQRSDDLGSGKVTSVGGASGVAPQDQPKTFATPLVSGAKLGKWSTADHPYYVNPDGTMYSKAASGALVMTGVNPNEYTQGTEIPKSDPNNPIQISMKGSLQDNTLNSSSAVDQHMNQVIRGQGATVEDTGIVKPVDYLAAVQLRGQGRSADPATMQAESSRILGGIGALMSGDKNATWVEPYLNDVARMAWAKENADNGIKVDPRSAPVDYIEKWKDGFYGSDPNITFVKDLDQQMIDHAVSFTPEGHPFNWKEAFGDTGEGGLISRQVASNDCGPNAFATMLRSRGYNADPATTFQFAKATGYHDGDQFTGAYNMSRMLREEAGLQSETKPVDWNAINAELDAGRPVALSSGGHYWVVASKRDTPNGTEYYTGATGAVVGNPQWARADQIQYGGHPNLMVTAKGDVDPHSRAVTQMDLRPPGQQMGGGRELLSERTNAAIAASQSKTTPNGEYRTRQLGANEQNVDPDEMYGPMIDRASREYKVDRNLIKAVMLSEDESLDPKAESGAGAAGLMQITEPTARSLGITDRTDPLQSIMGGTKYLRSLIDYYNGDMEKAIAAYNAGPGNVDTYGGIPPFEETQTYVPRVMSHYNRLTAQGQR